MHLERIEEEKTLRIKLSLQDLAKLVTKRYVIGNNPGEGGYVPDQSTMICHSRQRRVVRPEAYLEEGGMFSVLLPDIFLPSVALGIKDRKERYIDTELITVVELDPAELPPDS